MKIRKVATNRKAKFQYNIIEKIEAGIELKGSEIKSIREGKVSINEAYAVIRNGEVFLINMHIAEYKPASRFNPDTKRDRKLLLHKREILKLHNKITQKGYTLIPVSLYFKGSLLKVELALAKGKAKYEKKRAIIERDIKRETDRVLKSYKLY